MENKYIKYNISDFLQDEEFLAFAKKETNARSGIFQELLEAKDATSIKIEYALEALTEMEIIKKEEQQKAGFVSDKVWKKIDANISEADDEDDIIRTITGRKKTDPIKRRNFFIGLAAASVVLIAFIFFPSSDQTHMTRFEERTFLLPDESKVDLNQESFVQYDHKNWDKSRVVSLEGEAFFDVKKGSSFEVKTPQGTTTVLGTSFNVLARAGILSVECVTGSVQVKDNLGNESVLKPNESHNLIDGNLVDNLLPGRSNWKKQEYSYTNVPIRIVLQDIMHMYDVQILDGGKIETNKFTGFIPSDNLEQAMQSIVWPLNYTFEIEGKRVILNK